MTEIQSTPLMRQYHAIKQQVPNALLLFRLGDFYEMFFEDAATAARELSITLTARHGTPMCGVPYHASDGYIAKLIQRGYRVAICEQTEAAGQGKKLVNREIARIITPGTATEANVLNAKENNYLGAVGRDSKDPLRAALAYVDVSTGEFRVTLLPAHEVAPLVESLNIKEILLPVKDHTLSGLQTTLEPWVFDYEYCERLLKEHFKLLSLDGFGMGAQPLAVSAAGALLHYLKDTQKAALDHLDRPGYYERGEAMVLDPVTVRNLELVDPIFSSDLGGGKSSTLISVLDETVTGMGARMLRRRLLRPSVQQNEIEARLDAVEELRSATIPRTGLRDKLQGVYDIERLLAKVTMNTAGPRELLALAKSLNLVPAIQTPLRGFGAALLQHLNAQLVDLSELRTRVLQGLSDEPPVSIVDGGVIRDGVDPELDQLRDIQRNGKQYVAQVEVRERERTNIQSLKVRFNNVFGYYIEISKSNLHLVPSDYDRKQTLVNAERFTTPELKELESKILEAEERIQTIEKQLFTELRLFAASFALGIRQTATALAELDVLLALAEVAVSRRYTRPRFSTNNEFRVVGGRHPVVEKLVEADAARFIPNDIFLDSSKFVAVITGPNMGGKSTYLRQAAMMSILAQIGSFVPAEEALLPVVDRVFTRIGAADNLARGRSTFMVEMTETALILNTATNRSLVVLDEIGRGTSTYDGLALAWAVVEFLHQRVGAKTLFATHYHELTVLEENLPGVRNLHVSVKEAGDQIIFLRKVEPGAAGKSFGIEVARLAALPEVVIDRARQILALHEKQQLTPPGDRAPEPMQIQLFEPVGGNIASRIRALKLDDLRPIEALQILAELQKELQ
ncbi:DNA mismatch repair protein MutS [Bryobacter aggregatus]|uniref:DNA mismatch repair protein MutS n=1 Tax=Bryobacter aggregatus TaxID=360054 RepID=UPI0004E19F2A|nr:DNA mismatch repair protein MutS [Bryobacter aggregatus]